MATIIKFGPVQKMPGKNLGVVTIGNDTVTVSVAYVTENDTLLYMVETNEQAQFLAGLTDYIAKECGGKKARAARKFAVNREEIYRYLGGRLPQEPRRSAIIEILAAAGCYSENLAGYHRKSVTKAERGVTLRSADVTVLSAMLRYLLTLVEASKDRDDNPLKPQLDQEFQS